MKLHEDIGERAMQAALVTTEKTLHIVIPDEKKQSVFSDQRFREGLFIMSVDSWGQIFYRRGSTGNLQVGFWFKEPGSKKVLAYVQEWDAVFWKTLGFKTTQITLKFRTDVKNRGK